MYFLDSLIVPVTFFQWNSFLYYNINRFLLLQCCSRLCWTVQKFFCPCGITHVSLDYNFSHIYAKCLLSTPLLFILSVQSSSYVFGALCWIEKLAGCSGAWNPCSFKAIPATSTQYGILSLYSSRACYSFTWVPPWSITKLLFTSHSIPFPNTQNQELKYDGHTHSMHPNIQ